LEAAASQRFKAPRDSFGELDAESAASLLSAATDVALVLNAEGVIEDLSLGTQDPALEACQSWVGRRFADTVTVECRPKVEQLLRDAVATTEEEKSRKLMQQASRIVMKEDYGMLVLHFDKRAWATRSTIVFNPRVDTSTLAMEAKPAQ